MPIREAIARASSEHHAYFLIAAYIEDLQQRTAHNLLPQHLTALPILGVDDLPRRRDVARAMLDMFIRDRDSPNCAMRRCYEVFNTAVERIFELRQGATVLPA
jgi:hypothetical protein